MRAEGTRRRCSSARTELSLAVRGKGKKRSVFFARVEGLAAFPTLHRHPPDRRWGGDPTLLFLVSIFRSRKENRDPWIRPHYFHIHPYSWGKNGDSCAIFLLLKIELYMRHIKTATEELGILGEYLLQCSLCEPIDSAFT